MAITTGPHLPDTPTKMPEWATVGAINCRGRMQQLNDQYIIILQIEDYPGAVMEALGDTRGVRSLIDLNATKEMGLLVHYARGQEYSTFYGLGGKDQAYLGIM